MVRKIQNHFLEKGIWKLRPVVRNFLLDDLNGLTGTLEKIIEGKDKATAIKYGGNTKDIEESIGGIQQKLQIERWFILLTDHFKYDTQKNYYINTHFMKYLQAIRYLYTVAPVVISEHYKNVHTGADAARLIVSGKVPVEPIAVNNEVMRLEKIFAELVGEAKIDTQQNVHLMDTVYRKLKSIRVPLAGAFGLIAIVMQDDTEREKHLGDIEAGMEKIIGEFNDLIRLVEKSSAQKVTVRGE